MPSRPIFFDRNDGVMLDPSLDVSGSGLDDRLTGRHYDLNAVGRRVVAGWTGRRTVEDLRRRLRDAGATDRQAADDLDAFLAVLADAGLIRVSRGWRGWLLPAAVLDRVTRLATLDWAPPLGRRYPATVTGLLRACGRVTRWGWAGALLTSLAVGSLVWSASGGDGVAAVKGGSIVALLYAVFAGLLVVHELGHLVMARAVGLTGLQIRLSGPRISVSGRGGSASERRQVALAGPVAALAGGIVVGAAAAMLPLVPGLWWVPGVVGAAHLLSLLPWCGDGRILFERAVAEVDDDGVR